MSTTTILDCVRTAIAADVPLLLWGPPGIGKTSALMAEATRQGARVEVLIGSTLDPADVGGQPVPDASGMVQLSPPAWARRIRAALAAGEPVWLLLDELSCAPPSVQAALLRVVHDRAVGDVSLRGCQIIAAANPSDTAADGGWLSAATANRWCHLNWSLDASVWCAGELGGWGTPRGDREAAAAALVTGWVRHRPAALLDLPRDVGARGGAWPSPRSWSAAIRLLAALPGAPRAAALSPTGQALLNGCVGVPATAELTTWLAEADLPDPEDVLRGKAHLPARGDLAAATLDALVAAVLADRKDKDHRVERAWKVMAEARRDVVLGAAGALLEATGEVPDEARDLGRAIISIREGMA